MENQKNSNTKESENKSSYAPAYTKSKEKKSIFKKIIKGVVEWSVYAVIFFIIVWGTPLALSKILHTEYPIAAITSSSMWPVLKQDDLVFIKGVSSKDEINIGDIVVYKNTGAILRGGQFSFTIHRVIKKYTNTFVTQGDANNVEDAPVKYEQLIGKTVNYKGKPVRIPNLGKLSRIFNR